MIGSGLQVDHTTQKVLPARTRQACWSCPISERSSRFRLRDSEIADLKRAHLSAGKDSVSFLESTRIPRNDSRGSLQLARDNLLQRPATFRGVRGVKYKEIVQIVHGMNDIPLSDWSQQGISHCREAVRRRPETEMKGPQCVTTP